MSTSTAAAPANPVTILEETGARIPPGTVSGSRDVNGDLYASGSFPSGEQVTIYSCASEQSFQDEQALLAPDDSHGEITIPAKLTVIQVTAADDLTIGGYAWDVTPQQIAQDVHGLVITPAP